MDEYRKAVLNVLKAESTDKSKLGGRELLELIIKKWGVAYDIQLRKNAPFGEESANIYINVMWRYCGQKSFPMTEREYLEHLEAIGRYVTAIGRVQVDSVFSIAIYEFIIRKNIFLVQHFKDKVSESRKRPNAYFGYAVSFPLDVDPISADAFFKDLPYE